MFVAVVTNQDPLKSGQPEGDLSCYVGPTRDAAIAKALDAKARWELVFYANHGYSKSYRILIGELKEEAQAQNYKLVTFDEEF